MREKESCSIFSNVDQTINVRYFSHNTVDMDNVDNARRRGVKAKAINRVHFSHLVTVHKLADETEDRCSEWMRYAIDRQHFKRRIAVLAPTLERILTNDHRMYVKSAF